MSEDKKLSLAEQKDSIIQAGMQLIPYVGPSLAAYYYGNKQELRFKRIESFYEELQLDLERVKEHIIPIEQQYQEGLLALIEEVNDGVEKEHQNKKRQYYRNYMKNLMTNQLNQESFDKQKLFLDVLNGINLLEVEVLHLVYQEYVKNPNSMIMVGAFNRPGFDLYTFVGIVSKLKSYGFLRAVQTEISFGGNEDNALKEWISITDFGKEFVHFILN